MPRSATLYRETAETKIDVAFNLDGSGRSELSTGVGFFDHMLTHLAKHGLFDVPSVPVTNAPLCRVRAVHRKTCDDLAKCVRQAVLGKVARQTIVPGSANPSMGPGPGRRRSCECVPRRRPNKSVGTVSKDLKLDRVS